MSQFAYLTPEAVGATASAVASGSSSASALPTRPYTPQILNPSWSLKEISWPESRVGGMRRGVKIVCQGENGPCSLIALCNILVLRGSIHIDSSRSTVDYNYLSALIGDFLIERPRDDSDLSLEAALSILPTTIHGLDLNPCFSEAGKFEASGAGGALALFELCGVKLIHGWVADPSDPVERELMAERVGSYDRAQAMLVEGAVVEQALQSTGEITETDMVKLDETHRISKFLDATRTQLTHAGLLAIFDSLGPAECVALFRNSHLSVLYKRPSNPDEAVGGGASEGASAEVGSSSAPAPEHDAVPAGNSETLLFTLVSDEAFRREPEVVWEALEDVHSSAGFFNAEFGPSSTAGGDIAGLTAEEVDRSGGSYYGGGADDDADTQLARKLQAEEDFNGAQALVNRDQRRASKGRRERPPRPSKNVGQQQQQSTGSGGVSAADGSPGESRMNKTQKDKKKGCVVM